MKSRVTRRTLAPGIYEDQYGREVRWPDGRTKTKRFGFDVDLEQLKKFRARMIRQSTDRRRAQAGGSFVRDCVRFLRARKHRTCYKSDRAHLRPWMAKFRRLSRFAIERQAVQAAVDEWVALGYSARELRHRVKILQQLLRQLDPGEPTPCDGVKLPKVVKKKPRPLGGTVVRDVALSLRKQEITGRLRDAKTRARFLVLCLTGQRPAQLKRTSRDDVDMDRGIWYVDPAKGDEGSIVALNNQMRAAWHLFIVANAWGDYDSRSFSKTLQRNGWPKGIRPYNLRHDVGQALKELGTDLGDIQDHMGHASPETTRGFYLGPSLARQREISAKLEGRVDPFAVELPPLHDSLPQRSATTRQKQKAKEGEKSRVSAADTGHEKSRPARRLSKK